MSKKKKKYKNNIEKGGQFQTVRNNQKKSKIFENYIKIIMCSYNC